MLLMYVEEDCDWKLALFYIYWSEKIIIAFRSRDYSYRPRPSECLWRSYLERCVDYTTVVNSQENNAVTSR